MARVLVFRRLAACVPCNELGDLHPRRSPRMYGSTDYKDIKDLKDWPQARPGDLSRINAKTDKRINDDWFYGL